MSFPTFPSRHLGTAFRASAVLLLAGASGSATGSLGLAGDLEAQQMVVVRKQSGTPGWIGIQYQVQRSFVFGQPASVRSDYLVTDVHPDGPAARAGIQTGDVLVRIKGAGPADTLFENISQTLRSGDTVRISLRRGAQALTRPVVAIDRPSDEVVGALSVEDVAIPSHLTRVGGTIEERGGMTIVFRSEEGQGFSYRLVAPEPGTPFPFGAFVVRTPATDSLTSLINMMRKELERVERDSEVVRLAMLRAPNSEAVDANAAELVGLRELRSTMAHQLTGLHDELALLSRQRLGALERQTRDVRVRVSPGRPLTPLVHLERRYLVGAEIVAVDGELGQYFGVNEGVLVTASPEGTPARVAGLLAGDVIVRIGNQAVTNPADLSRAIRDATEGIVLTVVRSGSEMTVRLR